MKRSGVCALVFSVFAVSALAQDQLDTNAPATREDIVKYFEVTHSRQMLDQTVAAMTKPLRQVIHDDYIKDKDKLPADFEQRENQRIDEMLRTFPWDEMMQAMMPAYQKHFTRGDIATLLSFYSSPTGQKLLRELPAITGESMQAAIPILKRYSESVRARVDDELAQALKQPNKQTD